MVCSQYALPDSTFALATRLREIGLNGWQAARKTPILICRQAVEKSASPSAGSRLHGDVRQHDHSIDRERMASANLPNARRSSSTCSINNLNRRSARLTVKKNYPGNEVAR